MVSGAFEDVEEAAAAIADEADDNQPERAAVWICGSSVSELLLFDSSNRELVVSLSCVRPNELRVVETFVLPLGSDLRDLSAAERGAAVEEVAAMPNAPEVVMVSAKLRVRAADVDRPPFVLDDDRSIVLEDALNATFDVG